MNNLNKIVDDIKHIIWLLKQMIIGFIIFDYKQVRESYYWIRIHLTYKSKRIK